MSFLTIAGCTALCAALLVLEHVLCWDLPLSRPQRYTIGMLTVLACQALALGVLNASLLYIVALFVVGAGGGVFVLVAYWVRGYLERQRGQRTKIERAAGPLPPVEEYGPADRRN